MPATIGTNAHKKTHTAAPSAALAQSCSRCSLCAPCARTPHPPAPSGLLAVRSYEDNGDAVNNLVVLVQKVGKNNIDELGSPDKFLADNAYLFGESASFKGEPARRRQLPTAHCRAAASPAAGGCKDTLCACAC